MEPDLIVITDEMISYKRSEIDKKTKELEFIQKQIIEENIKIRAGFYSGQDPNTYFETYILPHQREYANLKKDIYKLSMLLQSLETFKIKLHEKGFKDTIESQINSYLG